MGENYQDHLEATVRCEVKDPSRSSARTRVCALSHILQYMLTETGLLTSTVVESGDFVDTARTDGPDVQFHVLPTFNGFADRAAEPEHGISIAIRITEALSLARLVKRRVLPRPGLERYPDALRDYVRSISKTVFHPSGTAKMGAADDVMIVVSEDQRVHGVEGLRVADASIMPRLVSGNTNAPTMMRTRGAAHPRQGSARVARSGRSDSHAERLASRDSIVTKAVTFGGRKRAAG